MAENFLTISMENQFSFKCPIFNAEVKMAGCVLVREKVYHGEAFPQRRGCQACVRGGKCPAAELVKRIAFNQPNATDRCGSKEAKVGRLPADVLEQIRLTVLTETTLSSLGVTEGERTLINSANVRIDEQIATAPRERVPGSVRIVSAASHSKAIKAGSAASVEAPIARTKTQAAISGDLAAALN